MLYVVFNTDKPTPFVNIGGVQFGPLGTGKYLGNDWSYLVIPEVAGRLLSVQVPSRATARDASFHGQFGDGVYAVLLARYNGRRSPTLFLTDEADHEPIGTGGAKCVWQYGDGHGMKFGALLRLDPVAQVKLSVTGHHDHGWARHIFKFQDGVVSRIPRNGGWKTPPVI
jgi:hypothetical protein